MKIMLSAGEASGDLHGASIAEALCTMDPEVQLFGFGGPEMERAGVRLVENYQDYSVMGFWEVLKNLSKIRHLLDRLTDEMAKEKPDLLVLIDYPDFNWRLAKRAKKLEIPVFSYIPPSAWAWRKGRAKSCAKLAEEFVAVYPFETEVYRKAGANISFVGNPLVDTVHADLTHLEAEQFFGVKRSEHPVLLMPGSRRQEVEIIYPIMLRAAKLLRRNEPSTRFFTPAAPGVPVKWLREQAERAGVDVSVVTEHRYDLMGLADFAIAVSGTVVMEAALMNLPCVVLYRMSPITYAIGKLFVHVDHFSLPNILLDKRLQPELLQDEVNPQRIAREGAKLYRGMKDALRVKVGLKHASQLLGPPGAAERVADRIWMAAKRSSDRKRNIGDMK